MVWNVRQSGTSSRARTITVVLCHWDLEGRLGYCVDYVYVAFIYCENLTWLIMKELKIVCVIRKSWSEKHPLLFIWLQKLCFLPEIFQTVPFLIVPFLISYEDNNHYSFFEIVYCLCVGMWQRQSSILNIELVSYRCVQQYTDYKSWLPMCPTQADHLPICTTSIQNW